MGDIAVKDMNSPTVGKVEDPQAGDRSSSSLASTPEHEELHEQDLPHNPEQQQQQKRKGGRKPVSHAMYIHIPEPALCRINMSHLTALTAERKIYATSEERKQRNRQAQAAFRERRTEYIKQLESTIKLHEENLQSLQQSHRSAADECLMLRYKNSLLERILLEKGNQPFNRGQRIASKPLTLSISGIDVQAELRQKGDSPNLGPTRMQVPAPISQPIKRYAVNQFAAQNRRSLTGMPPKADGVAQIHAANMSPLTQPTPTSRISSPATSATKSPNFLPQGGALSPSFGPANGQQQLRPQPLRPHFTPQQRPANGPAAYPTSAPGIGGANGIQGSSGTGAPATSYYPSPFQNHYDQLGKLSHLLWPLLRHRALFVLD
jgi:hypothetical protein